MTKQNQIILPFLKGSYCIIASIICVFCLLMIISPVSADTVSGDNFSFSNSLSQELQTHNFLIAANGGNIHSGAFNVYLNFSSLKSPTVILTQYATGSTAVQSTSGTFTLTYASNTFATGTFSLINGSFPGGLQGGMSSFGPYTAQFALVFTTFDGTGLSGAQQCSLTLSPSVGGAAVNFAAYQDPSGADLVPAYNLYAVFYSGNSGGHPIPVGGAYVINDKIVATDTFTGSSNATTKTFTFSVSKTSPSKVSVYSGNDGSLIWSESNPNSNTNSISNMLLTYQPVVFSSLFFGSYRVNSSIYFMSTDTYSVTWSPTSPVIGQSLTLQISNSSIGLLSGNDLNILDYINLIDTSTDTGLVLSSTAGASGYSIEKNSTGYWNADSGIAMTINLGTTLTLPAFSLQTKGTHNLILALERASDKTLYYANMSITVIGSESDLNLIIYPYDQITGNSISGAEYDILNPLTNTWANQTVYGTSYALNGVEHNRYYNGVIKANNYQTKSFSFYTGFVNGILDSTTGNINYQVPMYPTTNNIGTGNVSLSVQVKDSNTNGLVGASVTVVSQTSGVSYSSSDTTGVNSVATFETPMNATYKITAKLSGYQTGTSTVVVGTTSPVSIIIYLSAVVPTVTTTITYTTSPTVTTTPLPNGVVCDPTFWSKGENIMNISGSLQNYVACQGVKSDQNQKAIVGILITLVLLSLGAKYGGKIGAVIATSAGYIISILMGLFPIWTLILFCAIMGVVFAAKLLTAGASK